MDDVAKSEKDGYTLGNCAIGVCSVNSLFYKMPFDFKRELTPVFWATSLTNMLVVKNDGKIKTLDDFIKLAKSRELNYGSSGIGSAHHMSSELLEQGARDQVPARRLSGRGAGADSRDRGRNRLHDRERVVGGRLSRSPAS